MLWEGTLGARGELNQAMERRGRDRGMEGREGPSFQCGMGVAGNPSSLNLFPLVVTTCGSSWHPGVQGHPTWLARQWPLQLELIRAGGAIPVRTVLLGGDVHLELPWQSLIQAVGAAGQGWGWGMGQDVSLVP